MGNGMKLYKGIEVPYSCEDKEFRDVDFENKEKETEDRDERVLVNAEISDIQGFLTDEGYDISNDGKIGPETSGAIIDYIVDNNSDSFKPSTVLDLQKKINSCYSKDIKEDGKVGPETLNAIADALESAQQGDLCG
jgi:peptidoglycan hydrolase-like protein with peptidoglycan-binding domain